MLKSIARSALIAAAAAGATWLVRELVRQRGERRAVAHQHERKHAVANWEGEGGGVAPGHPALVLADLKTTA
jgi:hypothetical protein